MDKKVLSEIALYHGTVEMPKDFDIDRKKLSSDILDSGAQKDTPTEDGVIYYREKDCLLPFSRQSDMLDIYIREKFLIDYKMILELKNSFGNIFQPQDKSYLRHHVNPMDLKESPAFTMVYGVNVALDSCNIIIEYNNNNIKGLTCSLPLKENDYLVFPSHLRYMVSTNQSYKTNCMLTSTYKYLGDQ